MADSRKSFEAFPRICYRFRFILYFRMNIKMFLRRKFDTDFDCVIRLFEHNEKFKF